MTSISAMNSILNWKIQLCITGINYILKYMETETSILNNNLIFHNITVYINCQDVSTAVNPIYLFIYRICVMFIVINVIHCSFPVA